MAVTGEEETESSGSGTGMKLPQATSSLHHGEEKKASAPHSQAVASQKKELRLLKNREAARECRRKKKEYVRCLENRVSKLEHQNRTLIEELTALKDVYQTKVE
ncbi:cyclic AMP-responsive element-binding protein-like [Gouania willdenowi]|uniref:Cyclic AMP-responsive element-binding protein-like n=1 Tax=Gouania willdenowi TaxID=441366 RepID=A0A8C5GH98_GOUWI|nr:cyclic AMP-responsive element-binding protein-like [Gouania willdenowi]